MSAIGGDYGERPVEIDRFSLAGMWQEFMHYCYLPVRLPRAERKDPSRFGMDLAVPERLWFLTPAVRIALYDAMDNFTHLRDPYVYLTAHRGFASPGHSLNRPGWHCDDFGGEDLNYTWTDAYPTEFMLAEDRPLQLSPDDGLSMKEMEMYGSLRNLPSAGHGISFEKGKVDALYRLSPYVVHAPPEIPAPGGMRSFFKVSISNHRYDLIGNSHNYLLDYEWEMKDRKAVRNQPISANNMEGATT